MPSQTERSEVQEDIGKMRPAGKKNRFQWMPGCGATSGGVSVALTSKVMMPEGVDVRATPLVKDAEGNRPEVVLSRIAGGGGGGGRHRLPVMMKVQLTLMWLGRRLWPLLRRRPQLTLLGWHPRPTPCWVVPG